MSMVKDILEQKKTVAVIGLGYVGLPLAVAFGRKLTTIGFDINERRVEAYKQGIDLLGDLGNEAIQQANVEFTSNAERLKSADIFVVTVPTPLQEDKVPDLRFVQSASQVVGEHLRKGAIVVYESTVYPGVTEEICQPLIEEASGLKAGVDFKLGYSPERINPGDKIHRVENITKIVSGMDQETTEALAALYGLIVEAGIYQAQSIRIAEAAKVIENAQRDLNIAFMNELSMIFHAMEIDTQAVLEAAGTKWNFLPFRPGLVGGHCIGIDPYYLTYKAEDTGQRSRLILSGRHINDGMGQYIAQQIMKLAMRTFGEAHVMRIGILGLTYKENCPDIRNTKVIDVIHELKEYGIEPLVADALADSHEVQMEYGFELSPLSAMKDLDVVVVAVNHNAYATLDAEQLKTMYHADSVPVLIDIKACFSKEKMEEEGFVYWRL